MSHVEGNLKGISSKVLGNTKHIPQDDDSACEGTQHLLVFRT